MRTDIRLFKLDRFASAGPMRTDAEREAHRTRCWPKASSWAGETATLDSRPRAVEARSEVGRARACCSAASTSWSHEHGDLLRPFFERRVVDPFKDKFSALQRRLLVGRHAALRAARTCASNSRCIRSRRSPTAASISGKTLVDSRRRRRGDAAVRNGQHDRRRRRLALRLDRADRRAGRPAAVRESAELGPRGLALRPSEGARRPRGPLAVDDRRARQPAGQGEPARRADRPGRRGAGQRRDVHRRPAAPFVQHASASQAPVLQERLALQGRAAGPARGPCGGA